MAQNIVDTLQSNIFDVTRSYILSKRVYGSAEFAEVEDKLGLTGLKNTAERTSLSRPEQQKTLTYLLNTCRLNRNYDELMEYMLSSLRLDVYHDDSFEKFCRIAKIEVKEGKFHPTAQSVAEKLQGSKSSWFFLGQRESLKKAVVQEKSGTQGLFNVLLSAYYHQKVLGLASHSFEVISKYQKLFLKEDAVANEIKTKGLEDLGFTPEDNMFGKIEKIISFADLPEEESKKMLRDFEKSKLSLAGLYVTDAQDITMAGAQIRSYLISKIVEGALLGEQSDSIEARFARLTKTASKPLSDLISLQGETKKGLEKNIETYVQELHSVMGKDINKDFAAEFVMKCAEEGAFGFESKKERFLAYTKAAAELKLEAPELEADYGKVIDFKGQEVEYNKNELAKGFAAKFQEIVDKEAEDLQTLVNNILNPNEQQEIDPNVRPAYETLPYYQWCLKQARETLNKEAIAAIVERRLNNEDEERVEEEHVVEEEPAVVVEETPVVVEEEPAVVVEETPVVVEEEPAVVVEETPVVVGETDTQVPVEETGEGRTPGDGNSRNDSSQNPPVRGIANFGKKPYITTNRPLNPGEYVEATNGDITMRVGHSPDHSESSTSDPVE